MSAPATSKRALESSSPALDDPDPQKKRRLEPSHDPEETLNLLLPALDTATQLSRHTVEATRAARDAWTEVLDTADEGDDVCARFQRLLVEAQKRTRQARDAADGLLVSLKAHEQGCGTTLGVATAIPEAVLVEEGAGPGDPGYEADSEDM
ncbi:uncharacterized protein LOC62_02G003314 [Vanrija pseudolonga]|uniref:Uncharacterized protein n=1 Tax=Vanrija pseudolonga TaxID=143232 RepID=A0AAF1BPT1_9TREE|nr:hypothetical protein LOC62_02G003314 [Vanrija pseudolonga]